jgi:hypothetical protein
LRWLHLHLPSNKATKLPGAFLVGVLGQSVWYLEGGAHRLHFSPVLAGHILHMFVPGIACPAAFCPTLGNACSKDLFALSRVISVERLRGEYFNANQVEFALFLTRMWLQVSSCMQACILGVAATLLNVTYFVALPNFEPEDFGLFLILLLLVWVTLAHSGASLWVAALARGRKRLLLLHSSA